jgi:hypothetical protein
MPALKLGGFNGVHLNWPSWEYVLLQHLLIHCELLEHKAQSPSVRGVEEESTQIPALKPGGFNGVHLSWPSCEYVELQHPLLHCELVEHKAQSPSPPVGGGAVPPPNSTSFTL